MLLYFKILVRREPYPQLDALQTAVAIMKGSPEGILSLPPDALLDYPDIHSLMQMCLDRGNKLTALTKTDPNKRPSL